ncbi:hypothetical protein BU25DRAFT_111954 [Macroventuria anomochaeta]|uniref:Uncharacterized protein n=1 Tax=Macroventuria anomochaeta TaxID=301207 RepID=A0ACB6RY12_9PLEO|nr:uncharacterized protein BU25DRAFT_111954 [Macroventuria anomochaeta]KAF2625824.1 hypothetical protein BU25DRAFT_111954 [Macroventuria anomochaeta]
MSFPNSPSFFPFLQQPGELRNIVYSYALSEPEGLKCWEDMFLPKITAELSYNVINQLQDICHEILQEIRVLRIRYNDLTYETCVDASRFTRTLPVTALESLRMLHVTDQWISEENIGEGKATEYMYELFHVSRNIPFITVRLSSRMLHLRGGVLKLLAAESYIRGQDTFLRGSSPISKTKVCLQQSLSPFRKTDCLPRLSHTFQ